MIKKNFGIILLIILSTFSLILFRMKSIEQDYKMNDINKKIDEQKTQYKELFSQKEKLISIENLRELSKKFDFKEPSEKQIIIVPEK